MWAAAQVCERALTVNGHRFIRQFIDELERQGIAVGGNWVQRFFGDFVIGVGRRN